MRLQSLINRVKLFEMPVRNVELRGDFGPTGHDDSVLNDKIYPNYRHKPSNRKNSFTKATDIRKARHPKTEALLRQYFRQYSQNIDFYFINDNKSLEDSIKNGYGVKRFNDYRSNAYTSKIYATYGIVSEPGLTNIILVGNGYNKKYTQDNHPLSAWIIVHKFWQILYGNQHQKDLWGLSIKGIIDVYFKLVRDYLTIGRVAQNDDGPLPGQSRNTPEFNKVLKMFTFASARNEICANNSELIVELLTQHTLKGSVIMKDWDILWGETFDTPFNPDDPEAQKWKERYLEVSTEIKHTIKKMADLSMDNLNGASVVVF
jgi:hypothetical protein